MTNDEYLRSLTPEELSAWFAAEHVPDHVNGTLEDYQRQRMDKLLEQRDGWRVRYEKLRRQHDQLVDVYEELLDKIRDAKEVLSR